MKRKLCDHCGQNPVSVHYKETVNGVSTERYLCASCAKKLVPSKGGIFSEDWMKSFSLFPHPAAGQGESQVCPLCKTPLSRIRREGKFGCGTCYDTFASRLDMSSFVGSGYHGERTGAAKKEEKKTEKAPAPAAESLADLKRKLQEAVKTENYELAAVLRDRIRREEAN